MIGFVGLYSHSWVVMETMHFHIAQTNLFLGNFVLHLKGPAGVQGRLNWMPR